MEEGHKTYLFVHAIWSTAEKKPLLKKPVRQVLFAFVRSWAEGQLIRNLVINGVEDHVHCLFQWHPTQSLSKTIRDLQEVSAKWINENRFLEEGFAWQDGCSAYSVSPSAVKQVSDYILNQEEHHKTKTLQNELDTFEKIRI
jgi:putative transposase